MPRWLTLIMSIFQRQFAPHSSNCIPGEVEVCHWSGRRWCIFSSLPGAHGQGEYALACKCTSAIIYESGAECTLQPPASHTRWCSKSDFTLDGCCTKFWSTLSLNCCFSDEHYFCAVIWLCELRRAPNACSLALDANAAAASYCERAQIKICGTHATVWGCWRKCTGDERTGRRFCCRHKSWICHSHPLVWMV